MHVFSDKTGTLTKNYMSFKYMIAGSKVYGYDDAIESSKPIKNRKNSHAIGTIPKDISNVDFHDSKFMQMIQK